MTYREFLVALKDCEVKWAEGNDREIRTVRLPTDCPITAVCYSQGKGNFGPYRVEEASRELNLGPNILCRIIHASDATFFPPNHSRFKKVRRDLLKACGL